MLTRDFAGAQPAPWSDDGPRQIEMAGMPLRLVRPHDGAISDASNADDEPARPDWDLSLDGSKVMDQGVAPLSEADARSLVLRILRADLD